MATIKAIEGRSVHQIQSGQVIVDLTSVVKELVENSLDAGATSIEVRFKNQGLDSIEVLDNGKGIAPEDFETIALKHYTSKLSSYEDLTDLDTFGFRGEALSSLCALSKFHIITARSEDGAVGKKLDFETSGKLKGTSVIAAQRGTTVSVENLFSTLPVRRKELEKNIKREYAKVIGHLHAYACISVGVRFAVSNQVPKGKKVAVFSTKSNTTTKENITNVFGAKTLLALVKLDLRLEMEPSKGPLTQSARNWSAQAIDRSMEVQVQGHISKPVFGEGRQAPDRQMFFVNSRPCGLPQVSKAFNEVYRSFNVSQSPFIFANLIMDTNAYDVNVSPDKRSIMLHDQTSLLEHLKTALTELFENTNHTVPQSQLPNKKVPAFSPLNIQRPDSAEDCTPAVDEQSDEVSSEDEESDGEKVALPRTKGAVNRTAESLTQNWVGRDTERRRETPVIIKASNLSKERLKLAGSTKENGALDHPAQMTDQTVETRSATADESTSEDNSDLHAEPKAEKHNHTNDSPEPEVERAPDRMGSPCDDPFPQRPVNVPRRVQDFNALIDGTMPPPPSYGPSVHSTASQISANVVPSEGPEAMHGTRAPPDQPQFEDASAKHITAGSEIPATAPTPQKSTPGPVQNAFDRMRPKRTPQQTAEITVGDQTTTTVLGSDTSFKRRKIHTPQDSQAIAKFGGSPLLARGLRSFAAPGSQMQLDSSQVALPAFSSQSLSTEDELDAPSPAEPDVELESRHMAAALSRKTAPESDAPTSNALESLIPVPTDEDEFDGEYIDEEEKKSREDEKVAMLIQQAELAAAQPTEENLRRASQVLKNGGNRREATLNLACYVETSAEHIAKQSDRIGQKASVINKETIEPNAIIKDKLDDEGAESRLSLTVSKADFGRMFIVGQFNLGFVLAIRAATSEDDEDELFIIDQHAADEKYNYERLQHTVTLQNQRLVRPKPLELTAIEQEVILNHEDALKANGFEIELTVSEEDGGSIIRRCRLVTLPMTGEKTFDVSDLEELLHLLSEAPAGSSEIPRPKKVQKVLAMRACRSSIMVGKTLTLKQMQKVVRHMGEMEKPWNCPHGRPTMRHLAGLDAWSGWQEGEVVDANEEGADVGGRKTDWKGWLAER